MNLRITTSSIKHNLYNIPGWRTNRRIAVIDSDDWGVIRMPSKEIFNKLQKSGLNVADDPYSKYDSIASEQDLIYLYEVLTFFKDKMGNHPVITANSVVTNPDFEKIKAGNFEIYHHELITQTIDRYHDRNNAISLWEEGMRSGVFTPQFHAREHLNISKWMQALRAGNFAIRKAFNYGLFGINVPNGTGKRNDYMAAFDFDTIEDQKSLNQIAEEGMKIFEQIFKYRSVSFIAPCHVWSKDIEQTLSHLGVKIIKGIPFQLIPVIGKPSYKRILHYAGQKNKFHQVYLIRNAFFEPVLLKDSDPVGSCLKRIETAFRWGKPAIIGSHRINFIGSLETSNRDKNLKLLKELLGKVLQKWPDVEFISSDKLVKLIK